MGDGAFAAVRRPFTPAEIVELTLTAGFYAGVARVLRALQVDLEPGYPHDMI